MSVWHWLYCVQYWDSCSNRRWTGSTNNRERHSLPWNSMYTMEPHLVKVVVIVEVDYWVEPCRTTMTNREKQPWWVQLLPLLPHKSSLLLSRSLVVVLLEE